MNKIKVIFQTQINSWDCEGCNNDTMLNELIDYTSTFYNNDTYNPDYFDKEQVLKIVNKFYPDHIVEVIEDDYSS